MRFNQNKLILSTEIAEYILQFEEDDFKYYCDPDERVDHIYLVAYAHQFGTKAAAELLKELNESDDK